MERLDYILSSLWVIAGVIITWLFGEWEIGLQILITCMVLDFITGLMCGTKNKELSIDSIENIMN